MSHILAIEADLKRRRALTILVKEHIKADLVVVASVRAAIDEIAERAPDLILAPALLSPPDEAELLTHMKRLRNPQEPLERLISRASALGRHLGPLLYQLPPNLHLDLPRLDAFLAALPRAWSGRRLSHVMEFRHPSWYVSETFSLLEQRGVSLCLHDKRGSAVSTPFVGPIVYVRFHGTSGDYHGGYPSSTLNRWAHRLAEQSQQRRPVYAYFNNDPDAIATENAQTLRRQLARILQHTGSRLPSLVSRPP